MGDNTLTDQNRLTLKRPDLAEEWDYELNDVTPDMVTTGCNTKYYWRCKAHNHVFKASPNKRNLGTGCPYCNNHSVLEGFNDLASQFPEVAEEWHPTLNGELKPNHVSHKSAQRPYWLCRDCGYVWKTSIYHRTVEKTQCPNCGKHCGTSFPEKALYYYVKKIFDDAINNANDVIAPMELDVFIPSINTAIEYDGAGFHKNLSRDQKKNNLCSEQNIRIIRIREYGLPDMENAELIHRGPLRTGKSLDDAIRSAISLISEKASDIDTARDKNEILSLFPSNHAVSDGAYSAKNRQFGKVLCIETGKEYKNYKDAAADVGLKCSANIIRACLGRQKTAAGYQWKLVAA